MKLKILSTIAAISATATSAASLTCGDVQTLYQDDGCCTAAGQTCLKSLSIDAASNAGLTLSNTGELKLDLTNFQSDATFEAGYTVNFNGDVNFVNPLKTGAYIPASTACTSSAATHGFKSVWKTGYAPNGGWEMQLSAGHHTDFPDAACQVRELTIWDTGIYSTGSSYMGGLSVNGVTITSDSRIKKDIVDADIEDALQKVLDIELKEYGYTDPKQEGEKTVGFIAQQVKEVYPDAIAISDREEPIWNEAGERVEISDLHRIKKDKIYALHHGAIQSLVAKIAALEARLAALEA